MPRMSKAKAEAKTVNCPVPGCRRNLLLQPGQPGRLVAFCTCPKRNGLAVYETDAPTGNQETLAMEETTHGSS